MMKPVIHPLTKWAILLLWGLFVVPTGLIIAFYIFYSGYNMTNLTPVDDIVIQAAIIYGASSLAIIDLGTSLNKRPTV